MAALPSIIRPPRSTMSNARRFLPVEAAVRASRARIVAAAAAERLRIERRLRDRVEPRLAALTATLSQAREALRHGGDPTLAAALDRAVAGSREATEALRELARGVHPAILVDAGLLPALEVAARSLPLPVTIEGPTVAERPPPSVEAAAYFVVMEALTNVVEHARATAATVTVAFAAGRLRAEVRDDGAGGAAPGRGGSGLRGMADRVEALDGFLEVVSPAGGGTRVRFWLPAGQPPVAAWNAGRLEQLQASRARIVEAADAERRRIERDLHDGAQQRLVTLSVELALLRAAARAGANPVVEGCLARATGELRAALDQLRELARGIHPAILSEAGLGPALESLADRSPMQVTLSCAMLGRLPAPVETALYFAVAEVVASAAEHGRAPEARVRVERAGRRVVAEVAHGGSGGGAVRRALRRTADRIGALGGRLEVVRSSRGDTLVRVVVPTPVATA
jgi:signal transduction histidine kinase